VVGTECARLQGNPFRPADARARRRLGLSTDGGVGANKLIGIMSSQKLV